MRVKCFAQELNIMTLARASAIRLLTMLLDWRKHNLNQHFVDSSAIMFVFLLNCYSLLFCAVMECLLSQVMVSLQWPYQMMPKNDSRPI